MSNIKEFLKNLGLKSKEIDALLDEENQDINPKERATEFKTELKADIREAVKNDKEIRDEITKEVEGKYYGTLRSAFKNAGLSSEDVAEGKSPKEMIKALTEQFSEGKGKELKQVEEELLQANNKLKEYEDEIIPNIKLEAKREADSVHINGKLEELYKSIDKGRLVNDEHNPGFFKVASFNLGQEIEWKWENGEPVPYQKGTDLRAKNADGTKVATAQELLEQQLEKDGFIKKSNGKGTPQQPAGRQVQEPAPNGGKVIPGLAEAQANMKRFEEAQ